VKGKFDSLTQFVNPLFALFQTEPCTWKGIVQARTPGVGSISDGITSRVGGCLIVLCRRGRRHAMTGGALGFHRMAYKPGWWQLGSIVHRFILHHGRIPGHRRSRRGVTVRSAAGIPR
jgi:hypothetical protein